MPNTLACLREGQRARMSSAHMRRSNGSDSLNFSMSGSVAPVKRPPHSFFGSAAAAGPAASAATSVAAHACKGAPGREDADADVQEEAACARMTWKSTLPSSVCIVLGAQTVAPQEAQQEAQQQQWLCSDGSLPSSLPHLQPPELQQIIQRRSSTLVC